MVASALAVATGCSSGPQLARSVAMQIEADEGFLLTPPNVTGVSHGARRACVDDSGSPPAMWREFHATSSAEELIGFYDNRLPSKGWLHVDSGTTGGSRDSAYSRWEKSFGSRHVSLSVSVGLLDRFTSLLASTLCSSGQQ
jgi:hypothetical protein